MGRFERNQNFNYNRNGDEKQGRGIGPAIPNFNHIPNIRNQRRPITRFYDTSYEEAYFGEFANPCGRQRGGRQCQPNYRGDDKYKLKEHILNFSGDLDIEEFLDWLTVVDKFLEYTELFEDKKVKIIAYRFKRGSISMVG